MPQRIWVNLKLRVGDLTAAQLSDLVGRVVESAGDRLIVSRIKPVPDRRGRKTAQLETKGEGK